MTTYKRLGDYIREVNVRNRDEKVTKLVGLTIDKAFIPSVQIYKLFLIIPNFYRKN